jgi:hypothetical protein
MGGWQAPRSDDWAFVAAGSVLAECRPHATGPAGAGSPASTTMESAGRRGRANGRAYGGATRYPLTAFVMLADIEAGSV